VNFISYDSLLNLLQILFGFIHFGGFEDVFLLTWQISMLFSKNIFNFSLSDSLNIIVFFGNNFFISYNDDIISLFIDLSSLLVNRQLADFYTVYCNVRFKLLIRIFF